MQKDKKIDIMLNIANNTISEKDLDGFVDNKLIDILKKSNLPKEEVLKALHSLAENARWNIDNILPQIDQVENIKVRNWFRRYMISKKFGIQPYQKGHSNLYEICYVSDDCVLVSCPDNTSAVLTPQGEIKVPEGKVEINERSLSPYGFNARWNNMLGLYTKKGNVLFPCVFEDLSNPFDLSGSLQYKGFLYWYRIESEVPKEFLISPGIVFACDDKIYSIQFVQYNNDGYIHKGGVSVSREDEDPFVGLPYDKKEQLAKQNIAELFEIIKCTHPNGILNVYFDKDNPISVGC